jgi:hypothetical protein
MKDKLLGLLEPVVAALGYELIEVEWSSAGRSSLVRVYIDRTDGGGVGLDDCERVSRSAPSNGSKSPRRDSTGRCGRRNISRDSPEAKRGSSSRRRSKAAAGSAAGWGRSWMAK